jgi:hypothetical protein
MLASLIEYQRRHGKAVPALSDRNWWCIN